MIVGGGSEIARALVKELFHLGNYKEVLLIGRIGPSMEKTVTASKELFGPGQVHHLRCDFTDPAKTTTTVRQAMHDFRPVVSVIAAGINIVNPDSRARTEICLVNFVSMIAAGEQILQFNEDMKETTLIVLSSIAATRPRPSNYVYGSSKVALDFWALGAMASYPQSSEVILVRLGKVSTVSSENHPWAPFTKSPDYVGKRIASLIGSGSRKTWVPKVLGLLSKLMRLLPGNLWRRISTFQARG